MSVEVRSQHAFSSLAMAQSATIRVIRSYALLTLILGCALASSACNILQSEKRDVYKFDHPFNVGNPAFRRSLDGLGEAMVPGNTAVILRNGDEFFPAMTKAIREARHSVNLEIYIFMDDRAGKQFTDALTEAARKGVEVRVLVDGVGSRVGALKARLNDAGVILRKYRPFRLYTIHKTGKRTHRKILVVDGKVCFTGGMGIDERWLGNARGPSEWRDTMVQVTGPVASQMQSIFAEDWTFTTGEILAGDKFYPAHENAGSVTAQAIKVSRGDASSLAKMLYYVAIQSAEKSIHIQNAYFLPDRQVREALIQAAARGVDVQVMVPGRHIDIPLVRMASRRRYGALLKGGVKIFEYGPTMLHNKTMVVDGLYSTIGSINFDARSMQKNAEESLAFYDRDLGEKIEEMFQDDLKKCRKVEYQTWKHRGVHTRFCELFCWIWEPYY